MAYTLASIGRWGLQGAVASLLALGVSSLGCGGRAEDSAVPVAGDPSGDPGSTTEGAAGLWIYHNFVENAAAR